MYVFCGICCDYCVIIGCIMMSVFFSCEWSDLDLRYVNSGVYFMCLWFFSFGMVGVVFYLVIFLIFVGSLLY